MNSNAFKEFSSLCIKLGLKAPVKYKVQQKFIKKFKVWSWSDINDKQLEEAINYLKEKYGK